MVNTMILRLLRPVQNVFLSLWLMLPARGTFRSTLISIVSPMLTNTLCVSMAHRY